MNSNSHLNTHSTTRILGIDYGKKRVGTALSDTEKRIAFPHSVIENDIDLVDQILEICHKNSVEAVVIGDSKNYEGVENAIMKDTRRFVDRFEKKSTMKIVYEPEVLSTFEAARIQGETDMIDAGAASVILQSYLNRLKYKEEKDNKEEMVTE